MLVRDRGDGRVSLLTVPLSLAAAGASSSDRIEALFLPTSEDPWLLVRGAESAVDLHGRTVLPAGQATQLVVVGHGLAAKGAVLRGRIIDAHGGSEAAI